jgi:transcriptional regulator with XRE-family HTH domain
MGTNAVQRAATAETVSANVKRLRTDRNLGLRALATRLGEVGRPLGHSAVDQIEKGKRRVDVDDLMALAVALGVSPISLLLPGMPGADDRLAEVEVTGVKHRVLAQDLWHWLKAEPGPPSWVSVSPPLFTANAQPAWEWAHWSKDTDGDD